MTPPVDRFLLKSCKDDTSVLFLADERNARGTIVSLRAVITSENLSATATVEMEYAPISLGTWFERLAAHWAEWDGTEVLTSTCQELTLAATHDGRGHIAIVVTLAGPGPAVPGDWIAKATIHTEAGLLERIAADAKLFEPEPKASF